MANPEELSNRWLLLSTEFARPMFVIGLFITAIKGEIMCRFCSWNEQCQIEGKARHKKAEQGSMLRKILVRAALNIDMKVGNKTHMLDDPAVVVPGKISSVYGEL